MFGFLHLVSVSVMCCDPIRDPPPGALSVKSPAHVGLRGPSLLQWSSWVPIGPCGPAGTLPAVSAALMRLSLSRSLRVTARVPSEVWFDSVMFSRCSTGLQK